MLMVGVLVALFVSLSWSVWLFGVVVDGLEG